MKQLFLDNHPLDEVLEKYRIALEACGALDYMPEEILPVHKAVGRITSCSVSAKICSPHYHASAMDGFAVRAIDTFGASETNPVKLMSDLNYEQVDTGDPLPVGLDAVIKVEDVSIPEQGAIEIIAGAVPWQNVRPMGEDLVATEMILPANHRIRPVDIAALYAGGHSEIAVRKQPVVAVLPTGSELVEPGEPLERGSIIEFNSRMICAMVEELGGVGLRYPITADDYELLLQRVSGALLEADIVIINAGSSAGREDFTAKLIAELGNVVAHGVAIKPGKPVVLGLSGSKPIIGLPGYPVSAAITFNLFVAPLLHIKQGSRIFDQLAEAVVTQKLVSPLGVDEFVQVKLGRVGDILTATPLARGAGMVSSLVKADGVLRINSNSEGAHAGQTVKVSLLHQLEKILQTAVCIGSHDPAIDILADLLHVKYPEYQLASAHTGSLGGLMALRRGEAHMAGIHLLDEESGSYNQTFIERILAGQKAVLVNLAYRIQGLITTSGNPKKINGLSDLVREDLSFINRQSGSGTRVLLDYQLKLSGIKRESINGYTREEFTHLAVGAAVLAGSADCGLGVLAAAQALGLDFIPVAEERFDLCIPKQYLGTPHVEACLEIMRSEEFKQRVAALGGYDLRDCGKLM